MDDGEEVGAPSFQTRKVASPPPPEPGAASNPSSSARIALVDDRAERERQHSEIGVTKAVSKSPPAGGRITLDAQRGKVAAAHSQQPHASPRAAAPVPPKVPKGGFQSLPRPVQCKMLLHPLQGQMLPQLLQLQQSLPNRQHFYCVASMDPVVSGICTCAKLTQTFQNIPNNPRAPPNESNESEIIVHGKAIPDHSTPLLTILTHSKVTPILSFRVGEC